MLFILVSSEDDEVSHILGKVLIVKLEYIILKVSAPTKGIFLFCYRLHKKQS